MRGPHIAAYFQRGRALSTVNDQYLNLGYHSSICLTHPDKCTEGETMTAWVNMQSCPELNDAALISSFDGSNSKTSFKIHCSGSG